jgi:multidrug efflux pump subunit AcrB
MRWLFLGMVTVMLMLSMSLVYFRAVVVKMLPFDNKSEFQVVVDMPEGTTLEQTAQATQEMGRYLSTVPEVTDYTQYIGMAAPYNFNGLVRHYFLRKGPNVACIQVSLLPKGKRKVQSHAIAKAISNVVENRRSGRYPGAKLHVSGIISQGYLHSDPEVLDRILEVCKDAGLSGEQVVIHGITDGKDVPDRTSFERIKGMGPYFQQQEERWLN